MRVGSHDRRRAYRQRSGSMLWLFIAPGIVQDAAAAPLRPNAATPRPFGPPSPLMNLLFDSRTSARLAGRSRCAAVSLLAALGAAWPSSARAANPPVKFSWTAPPQCPDPASVRGKLDTYLERMPGELERSVEAQATVTQKGDTFALELKLRVDQAEGLRSVQSRDCALLGEAAALLTAMAIDPGAAAAADPDVLGQLANNDEATSDDPTAEDPTTASDPDPDPANTEPDPSDEIDAPGPPAGPPDALKPRLWIFGARAGAFAGLGALPGAEFGPELGAFVARRRLHLGVRGRWAPPRTRAIEDLQPGRARWQLWTLGAQVGAAVVERAWTRLRVGGSAAVGQIRVEALDVPQASDAAAPWFELGAALTWDVRLWQWLWLDVGAQGTFHPSRPRFDIENFGEVHRPALAGFRGYIALQARFGAG